MINAKIDDNGRPTLIGVSNSDGKTIIPLVQNRHIVKVNDNTTGSDNGGIGNARIDENSKSTMTAYTSTGQIINLYVDAITKKLLINRN